MIDYSKHKDVGDELITDLARWRTTFAANDVRVDDRVQIIDINQTYHEIADDILTGYKLVCFNGSFGGFISADVEIIFKNNFIIQIINQTQAGKVGCHSTKEKAVAEVLARAPKYYMRGATYQVNFSLFDDEVKKTLGINEIIIYEPFIKEVKDQ